MTCVMAQLSWLNVGQYAAAATMWRTTSITDEIIWQNGVLLIYLHLREKICLKQSKLIAAMLNLGFLYCQRMKLCMSRFVFVCEKHVNSLPNTIPERKLGRILKFFEGVVVHHEGNECVVIHGKQIRFSCCVYTNWCHMLAQYQMIFFRPFLWIQWNNCKFWIMWRIKCNKMVNVSWFFLIN